MKPFFESHLKKHVLQIGRDAYIQPSDPFYIEKVLRHKIESPELHYRLGLEHEKEGRYSRALFHYIEAIRFDSTQDSKAKEALVQLEKKLTRGSHEKATTRYMTSPFTMSLMIILAVTNLILIFLLILFIK